MNPLTVTMNQGQTTTVTASPYDNQTPPQPGSLTATVPVWKGSDPSLIITPAANGLSATVKAGTIPGTFTVSVTAQGMPGGPLFTSTFTVVVNQNFASQFLFTATQPQ